METIALLKQNLATMIGLALGDTQYDGHYDCTKWCGVPNLIDDWYEAKKHFINATGNELVFKPFGDKPVTIAATDIDELAAIKVQEFLDELNRRNIMPIHCVGFFSFRTFMEHNSSGFFNNRVSSNAVASIKIGAKLSRAFKLFFAPETCRLAQDIYSVYVQQNKVSGILCLSVHPMDYLTISTNNAKWHSCHALEDGEYRSGNGSYMCDSSTVVCYLKSSTDCIFKGRAYEWNSKKWRVLLHFNQDGKACMMSRQYPFNLLSLDIFTEVIEQFAVKSFNYDTDIPFGPFINWHSEVELDDPHQYNHSKQFLDLNGDKQNMLTYVVTPDTQLFYSDISCADSKSVPPWLALRGLQSPEYMKHFKIGEDMTCIQCGVHSVESAIAFTCHDCVETYIPTSYYVCEHCHCVIHPDDTYFDDDGYQFCDDCWHDIYFYCSDCDKYYTRDHGRDTGDGCTVCDNCICSYDIEPDEDEDYSEDD